MEQPNVTGDGEAALSLRFWLAVVVVGVAAGLFGALMMWLLFTVQHAAFGYRTGGFEAGVKATSATRRVVVLLIAGLIGGFGWFVLRRLTRGQSAEIDDAVWSGSGQLAVPKSIGTSVLSEIVVGMGASLGREAAPKLLGGMSGSLVASWVRLSPAQRRLLVACGGGAGFAAVYNVPLGGALFAAEVLCGSIALPTVLPAVVCAGVATLTAWIYLPDNATYLDIPRYHPDTRIVVWAPIAGIVIGLISTLYVRAIGWISHYRITGWRSGPVMVAGFGVVGVVGIAYPQLFGNGKGMAHDAFIGHGTAALFAALVLLKPIATLLCLSAGAQGGLFTPVLSTGAVLGALLGELWQDVWPGSPLGAYALIGAAALIGSTMQAPLSALALVLELTHSGFELMVPMVIATGIATAITRWIDGYSIYSARLPARTASPHVRRRDRRLRGMSPRVRRPSRS